MTNLQIRMKKIEKFKNELHIFENNSNDSLYNAILFALSFEISRKIDFLTSESDIGDYIGEDIFKNLKNSKNGF